MSKNDEDEKRSQVIKARFTLAEARTVKQMAHGYRMSLSDYLRAASLKLQLKQPPEARLLVSKQLEAIEQRLTTILEQSLHQPDRLLIWEKLSKLSEQIEHLASKGDR